MRKVYLPLFGLMLGVAAAPGANEARAVVVLEAVRSVALTASDGSFVSVGFKRHGFHPAPGGIHEKFRGPRSFAGKRFGHGGVLVRKNFVGPGLFRSKHFRTPGASALKRLPGSRFLNAPGHRGSIVAGKGSIGPRLFPGKRFGDRVIVRSRFAVTPRSVGQRFGATGFVVRNASVGTKLFVGRRFGDGQVVVRPGLVGLQSALGKGFQHRAMFTGGDRRRPRH